MRNSLRRDWLFGSSVNFDSVASGEEKRLRAACFIAQNSVDRGVADEALARFDICSVMAQPDAEKVHQSEWDWERKVMPQSKVSAALKATTQSAAIRRGPVVPR